MLSQVTQICKEIHKKNFINKIEIINNMFINISIKYCTYITSTTMLFFYLVSIENDTSVWSILVHQWNKNVSISAAIGKVE